MSLHYDDVELIKRTSTYPRNDDNNPQIHTERYNGHQQHNIHHDIPTTHTTLISVHSASNKDNPSSNTGNLSMHWQSFDFGMRFGATLLLLCWVLWDCLIDARLRPSNQDLWVQSILPVYRGCGCMILLFWLYGCNLYIWEKYRMNISTLFELNEKHGFYQLPAFLSYTTVFTLANEMSGVFLFNFLIYFKMIRGDFPVSIQNTFIAMSILIPSVGFLSDVYFVGYCSLCYLCCLLLLAVGS